ncbi:MAG: nuclear transport factor 2 family protein [Bacteroidota bacterium]
MRLLYLFPMIGLLVMSCMQQRKAASTAIPDYQVIDADLQQTIEALDKQYFDAYNNCDLETQANLMADDIEFFHDQGGLATSKSDIIASIERNICGKVTRTLIAGSLEVYPINNYGAVSIGYHKFFNNQEPDAPSIPSKFITIWRQDGEVWQMAKVVSLH